jgi:Restriction endonuclease
MELSDNQRLYLQTIFDYFHEHGVWPTYKYIDRKLNEVRRDLDMEKIAKGVPSGFASAFAFNRDLNAPAILNIFAINECTGSKEDLAGFVKAIHYGVERYFSAREDEATIVITKDELKEQLSLSELALRKIGLLIKDASEYRIYDSFGSKEEDGWWSWTLSREIRYFDGVTSIDEYLAKIDQLRKPPLLTSRSHAQTSEMNDLTNDRGKSKSNPASAALEGYLFQQFVSELLQASGFIDVVEPKNGDVGYDFQASYPIKSPTGNTTQQLWLVEVKYRRSGKKTTIDALHQLVANTQLMKAYKALLVTNTNLTSFAKEFIMQLDAGVKSKLEVWDGDKLLSLLAQFPDLDRKYPKVRANLSGSSKPFTTRQQLLIEELAKCKPGQQDCHKYEDICIAILTEVFVPPLKQPRVQPRTLNGLERRDALFPLRGAKHGWEEVRQEFDANFLLCEFKNYTQQFGKDEVNQTRNYLRQTIGRIGIIFSRMGASESAKQMRNSIYTQEQKVILFLEDKHLIELLKWKETGQDPLELIQEAIDEFYALCE